MKILENYDHESLIPFYTKRGIEELTNFPNPPVFSYIIKNRDELIGAVTCSKADDTYILEAIAICETHTGKKIGSKLLKQVIKKLKSIKARRVVINAKNTSFFEKNGFILIDKNKAPVSSYKYCENCRDYGVKCFPKIMEYRIEDEKI